MPTPVAVAAWGEASSSSNGACAALPQHQLQRPIEAVGAGIPLLSSCPAHIAGLRQALPPALCPALALVPLHASLLAGVLPTQAAAGSCSSSCSFCQLLHQQGCHGGWGGVGGCAQREGALGSAGLLHQPPLADGAPQQAHGLLVGAQG